MAFYLCRSCLDRGSLTHLGCVLVVPRKTNKTPFTQLIFSILMWKMPLYTNIKGRMIVYWLSQIGVRPRLPWLAPPLLMICTSWAPAP